MTAETKPLSGQRMQPLVALRALRTLINDPEQTGQVFVVIEAMSGDSLERAFARFEQTGTGRRVLDERRVLLNRLRDRDGLRRLEPGSLGRAYLDFVETEQITADGLVQASTMETRIDAPRLRLFGERMRDQHDLWHVVTGYGRDPFGEACLLAFTYAQTRNRGLGVIALVGSFRLARELGPGVRKAMWQACRAGGRAAWLPEQDWEALLARPLREVRRQLGIEPPRTYRALLDARQTAKARPA